SPLVMRSRAPRYTLFPYTTLFRSKQREGPVMRILIADDDREICDLLEIYINNEGFEVIKAYDGKEAYQKVVETDPDCLVLDIMIDRKSTRLNSSHVSISYAVFRLK